MTRLAGKKASSIASETKCIITGLLTSNPLKCTVQQLCRDFKNTVGYNIPIRQLGFNNVEDYLRSIPDTVTVYGSGSNAQVDGIVKPNSAHISHMVEKQRKNCIPEHKKKLIKKASSSRSSNDTNRNGSNWSDYRSRVPPSIQNNLRKLILKFPSGIWCGNLPDEYMNMFHQPLSYRKFGYRSLIEMCSDLSEILRFVQVSSDDFILYDKNKPIPSLDQNDQPAKIPELPQFDWESAPSYIPSDVECMFLGDVIPRIRLQEFKFGSLFFVDVGEIYNISKFFIFLIDDKFTTFFKEMQRFFCIQSNKYEIHELLLEQGLYCACFQEGEYHRAAIVDLLPQLPGFVRVFFIDYGTVGNVCCNQLFFLPKKFGEMAAQAIRAQLWNLRPPYNEDEWNTESINKFKKCITNTKLVAEVIDVEAENNKALEIYLADVTDENNIFYINDRLVEQGYGCYIHKIAE